MTMTNAKTKHVRISPRKARYAADMIRNKPVMEAFLILEYSNLKAGRLLKKTLKSAVANAENNNSQKREELFVSTIKVDEGASFKRGWARSRGRTARIIRRTSHFFIGLDSISNRKKGK